MRGLGEDFGLPVGLLQFRSTIGWMGIEVVFIVLGIILVSMTLHEVMHGYAAYWLGDDTAKHLGRLTLNPVKHIDPFLSILLPFLLLVAGGPVFGGAKPVPFNPARLRYDEWGVALVAAAGPLTNIALAFLGFGLATLMGTSITTPGDASILGYILAYFVQINLGFVVFNLLPLPPLDGSRILYALAPDFVRRGMEAIEQFGIMVVFFIILVANSFIISYIVRGVSFFLDVFSWIFGLA